MKKERNLISFRENVSEEYLMNKNHSKVVVKGKN
jgi:hypothetical protein